MSKVRTISCEIRLAKSEKLSAANVSCWLHPPDMNIRSKGNVV